MSVVMLSKRLLRVWSTLRGALKASIMKSKVSFSHAD